MGGARQGRLARGLGRGVRGVPIGSDEGHIGIGPWRPGAGVGGKGRDIER